MCNRRIGRDNIELIRKRHVSNIAYKENGQLRKQLRKQLLRKLLLLDQFKKE